MKTVRRLLQAKGSTVWAIAPDALVSEALRVMADRDVGALVVTDQDRVAGIITERDIARKALLHGRLPDYVRVRDIMTDRVLYVRADQTVDECMALMTDKHLRHLPVIEDGRLLGVVSMRDVVADLIAEKTFLIEQLENYIYELPPYQKA
jgi:CBS domain-containing protein